MAELRQEMVMSKWAPIVLSVLMCVACDRTPDHVIKPKDMASLLADIHKGEGVIDLQSSHYRNDSAKKVFRQSIYMSHGVTQEDFDTSLVWYGHNIDKYKEVYEMVIKQLEDELNSADIAADGQTVQVSVVGDSVNVWGELPYRRFASGNPTDFIRFNFASDENWEKGDAYQWKLFANNHALPIQWALCADYVDGTTDYVSSRFYNNGWQELKLYTDTARVLKNIYGMVQYQPSNGEVVYIDSISLFRTRFSPDEYYRGIVKHYNNRK